MKKIYYILTIGVVLFSCEKNNENNKSNDSSIIAEFPFDNSDELIEWQLNERDSAIMTIDTDEKKVGNGSFKLYNQCTSIIREEGINVTPRGNYEISFFAKSQKFSPGESSCAYAYNFALVVIQGNNDDWHTIYLDSKDWYEKNIYFSSDSTGLPIKIRFLMGQKAGWIDDFKIKELK